MVEKYSTVYMYPIVSIHSSVLLQLTCFPVLAVVTSGAEITGYVSIKILVVSTPAQSRHETQPAQAPGMGEQPNSGRSWGMK